MLSRRSVLAGLAGLLIPAKVHARITPKTIETAEFESGIDVLAEKPLPQLARLQIMLDRANFSPGVIDGHGGENTGNALAAFRAYHQLEEGEDLTDEVWQLLQQISEGPVLREYKISKNDFEGPFLDRVPERLEEQAELDHLGYTSPIELLAEKFHMQEEFLRALNPAADFAEAGQRIQVANVERDPSSKVTFIEVDVSEKYLRAFDESGDLIAHFPATVGSDSRPAPMGTFTIARVAKSPVYTYDPNRVTFEGVKADKPFDIAPGPNNPVGVVWIEIDEDGYGIHGTPEPAQIGKTFSHGCIRLTNWDALHLAQMVRKGVEVDIA